MPALDKLADEVRQVAVLALRRQQELFVQSEEVLGRFLARLLRIRIALGDDQLILAHHWLALRNDLIGVQAVEDFVDVDR